MVIETSALRDRLEHRRIELVAVVQDVDPVARHERHPGRPGHRRQELFVVDRELVVESVPRWELGGRDQVTDERHGPGADRPAPRVVDHVPQERAAPTATRTRAAGAPASRTESALWASASADPAPFGSASGSPPAGRAAARSAAGGGRGGRRRSSGGWGRGRAIGVLRPRISDAGSALSAHGLLTRGRDARSLRHVPQLGDVRRVCAGGRGPLLGPGHPGARRPWRS